MSFVRLNSRYQARPALFLKDNMKYTKILQRDLDFNMAPEHAQELRSEAQKLQLEVQDHFAMIKDLNQKIGTIIFEISKGKVVKTCKCIEEIDTETKMVK